MSDDRRQLREAARRQAEYDWEVRRAHQEIMNVERRRAAGRIIFGIFAIVGPIVFWSLVFPTTADNNWILAIIYRVLIILTVVGLFWFRRIMTRRFMAWVARRSDEQRTEAEADHG